MMRMTVGEKSIIIGQGNRRRGIVKRRKQEWKKKSYDVEEEGNNSWRGKMVENNRGKNGGEQ